MIYTLSLLTLLTRIQLNLLGRRNYLSSVVSLASPSNDASTIRLEDHDDEFSQAFGNDFETNRRYLTFSWWLLHRGWKDLTAKVRSTVEEVFGALNPREDITLKRLSELVLEVRKHVEGATEEDRRLALKFIGCRPFHTDLFSRAANWLQYLLPSKEDEGIVLQESGVLSPDSPSSPQTAASLRQLLDETSDLIESPSFSRILTALNNEGFATLIEDKCAKIVFKSPPTSEPATAAALSSAATIVPTPSPPKAKLATILALITREAHVIGNGTSSPNEYLSVMEQNVRDLEAFAAVVYSSNFQLELLHSGDASSPSAQMNTVKSSTALQSDPNTSSPKEALEKQPAGEDSAFEEVWGKAVENSESAT